MNFYEITCYVNEDDSDHQVYEKLKQIILTEKKSTLLKSWKNGYNLKLVGFFNNEKVHQYYYELSTIIQNKPTSTYDVESFKRKYLMVAKVTNDSDALDEIIQNKIYLKQIFGYYNFQNYEQLHLYITIHQVFDSIYIDNYWNVNDVLTIVKDIMPFIKSLPDKVISESDLLYSNGFTSHLSHYIGFLNTLNKGDREHIQAIFKKRVMEDITYLTSNDMKENTPLVNGLFKIYRQISSYVEDGMINFYSPHSLDQFQAGINNNSNRHTKIFENPTLKKAVLHDNVLCTNKWILNVLYEKLVLLNIKPIDKFYMNFLISSFRYDSKSMEVS
ncbi:hypothetical protein ACSVDA_00585 [Cytobacillus sp. Hm23]